MQIRSKSYRQKKWIIREKKLCNGTGYDNSLCTSQNKFTRKNIRIQSGWEKWAENIKRRARDFPLKVLRRRSRIQITTERHRKNILQITQPSQYRCTQLQYRFVVTYGAPSIEAKRLIVYDILLKFVRWFFYLYIATPGSSSTLHYSWILPGREEISNLNRFIVPPSHLTGLFTKLPVLN